MQNLNKKGISEIVQITSIIALSIIAITMIWGYVSYLSNIASNQLSPTVDCLQLQTRITSACINSEGNIEVTINKAITDKITRVNLVGDNNFKASCGESCSTCLLQESDSKKIFLENSNLQEGNKIYLTTDSCRTPLSETAITLC